MSWTDAAAYAAALAALAWLLRGAPLPAGFRRWCEAPPHEGPPREW